MVKEAGVVYSNSQVVFWRVAMAVPRTGDTYRLLKDHRVVTQQLKAAPWRR